MRLIYIPTMCLLIFMALSLNGQQISRVKSSDNPSVSPYFSEYQETYDVKFYFIDLEVNNINSFIKGRTLINVEILSETGFLVFELDSRLNIDSVKVNSMKINEFVKDSNLLKIKLPASLSNETILSADIYYNGLAGIQSFYGGVTTKQDYKYQKTATYTLSEPFQSMLWFPCKQDLRDKADSAWIFITVPKGLKAGSNGFLTNITSTDSTMRYEWKTKYPTAYYLLSFSVSDYIDYSFKISLPGVTDSLLIQNFVYNHYAILDNEKAAIDKTGDLILLFSDLLGTYPFYEEKYGHCMAPMGGGMEHQTMTTLASFNFELVAHELAHQWFGNFVTCKTWQDIWINEGFASYLEYLALEILMPPAEASNWMINAQTNAKKHPVGSVYVPLNDAKSETRIFNSDLSYKKGAAILHMLRHEINNDELFFKALQTFLEEYSFSTATGNDFLNTLNRVTENDYAWFFDQWYYGKGFPVFMASWQRENDSIIITATQESSSSETLFFLTHLDYRFIFYDSTYEDFRVFFNENNKRFSFNTQKPVAKIVVDPENKVLKTSVIYEKYREDLLFQVSPNPFTSNLYIKFTSGIKNRNLSFTQLNGIRIFETSTLSDYLNLNLSFLKEGIYIMTIMEDGKEYPVKIVKTNQINE